MNSLESGAAFAKFLSESLPEIFAPMEDYMKRIGLTIEEYSSMSEDEKTQANIDWHNSQEYINSIK
jgi:hypothetical protein